MFACNATVTVVFFVARDACLLANSEVTVYFANGQAENRRVVVRVLQNKAIAGV